MTSRPIASVLPMLFPSWSSEEVEKWALCRVWKHISEAAITSTLTRSVGMFSTSTIYLLGLLSTPLHHIFHIFMHYH